MLSNFNGGASAPPSSRHNLLEATKLSRLPTLPKREQLLMPEFKIEPNIFQSVAGRSSCVNCKRGLKSEVEYCQSVGVCRACLNIYGVIDSQLNAAAEKRAIENKRAAFTEKLRF